MAFQTRVTVETERLTTMMLRLISALGPNERTELYEAGARAAVNAAKRYHTIYDKAGGWRGERSFGSGSSDFGARVANRWNTVAFDAAGAEIGNDAPHLRQKVKGGTIRPKKAKALTIPLTREAHGRRARDYESFTGRKLFTIPGGKALFESVPESAGGSKLRAVYALRKFVTQDPWPGALPPIDDLGNEFAGAVGMALADILERGGAG